MNFKHDEEWKDAWERIKRFEINKDTLERSSKVKEKKDKWENDGEMSTRHLLDAKW